MKEVTITIGCVITLLIAGCVNISNKLTPDNLEVKPLAEGSDCSYAVMGLGFGTNTVERAMVNASPVVIQKIRSVTFDWIYILFVGAQCITVNGEPFTGAMKPKAYNPTEMPQ